MSGSEADEILGVMSEIIKIIDTTKKLFEASKDVQELPEAFRMVASRLLLVRNILSLCKQRKNEYFLRTQKGFLKHAGRKRRNQKTSFLGLFTQKMHLGQKFILLL